MKRESHIMLRLLAVIGFLAVCYQDLFAGEVRFSQTLPPVLPPKARIYKFKAPDVTIKGLSSIAKALGLNSISGKYDEQQKFISYVEGDYIVIQWKASGAINFKNTKRYYKEDSGAPSINLPDDQAIDITRNFIISKGLVNEHELFLEKVSHRRMVAVDKQMTQRIEKTVETIVIFGRKINNVSVDGPGGKILVYVGTDGGIIGLKKVWREIDREIGRVNVVNRDKALSNIVGRLSVFPKAEILKARFCYFEKGEEDAQTYLEPAYVFVYSAGNENFPEKSVDILPASDKIFEGFTR